MNLNSLIKLYLTALTTIGAPSLPLCQELRIDHVISINAQLEEAVRNFSDKGFMIKPGRLHENGLINAHIKFQNSTSFELMSLEGEPTDAIAEEYQRLLKSGVTGAYLALTGLSRDDIERVLKSLNLEFQVLPGKLWTYISFPNYSEFAHIFFIIYHVNPPYQEQFTMHKNGFEEIRSVTIEGTQNLVELFEKLHLKIEKKDGAVAEFKTKTGNIIVRLLSDSRQRPRIKEITFGKSNAKDTLSMPLD